MKIGNIGNFGSFKAGVKKITIEKKQLPAQNQGQNPKTIVCICCDAPRSIAEDDFRGFTKSFYTPLEDDEFVLEEK